MLPVVTKNERSLLSPSCEDGDTSFPSTEEPTRIYADGDINQSVPLID